MIMDFKKKLVDVWERIANSLKWCWKPISPDATFSLIMRPVVLVVVLIVLFVGYKYEPDIAYFLGGILLLAQVQASSQRANAADETAKAMQKTADLTEKGNIAERFKNAIEHLGHKSTSIRLGGIYALHHIAQDVEEYRERIFEILCAHIRETTTQDGYKPQNLQKGKGSSGVLFQPSIEIQSILKLLFVDSPGCDAYMDFVANLEHSDLKGTILNHANLNSTIFNNAELQGAKFEVADLQDADFSNTNLQDADFLVAELQGAHFRKADLQCAHFQVTDLQDADFSNTNLQDADFLAANLQGADLSGTQNLTAKQLLKAGTLYKAKLPDGMEAKIKQLKPELLEKPKADNEPDV